MPVTSHAPPEQRAPLDTDDLLALYRGMLRIRLFEERAATFYQQGSIPGPVVRVGAPPTPAPYAPPLEQATVPTGFQVEAAVRRLMSF